MTVFHEVIENGAGVDKEVMTKTGECYLMRIFPYRISKEFSSGAVVMFIDITLRKKNETKLEHLAAVVMDSNDAIVEHDFQGRILAWNKGAESIYGYTEAEALKMNINVLVHEDQKESGLAYIRSIRQGTEAKASKVKRVAKNGDTIDILLKATALLNESGIPVTVATIEQNITGLPDECIRLEV